MLAAYSRSESQVLVEYATTPDKHSSIQPQVHKNLLFVKTLYDRDWREDYFDIISVFKIAFSRKLYHSNLKRDRYYRERPRANHVSELPWNTSHILIITTPVDVPW